MMFDMGVDPWETGRGDRTITAPAENQQKIQQILLLSKYVASVISSYLYCRQSLSLYWISSHYRRNEALHRGKNLEGLSGVASGQPRGHVPSLN